MNYVFEEKTERNAHHVGTMASMLLTMSQQQFNATCKDLARRAFDAGVPSDPDGDEFMSWLYSQPEFLSETEACEEMLLKVASFIGEMELERAWEDDYWDYVTALHGCPWTEE